MSGPELIRINDLIKSLIKPREARFQKTVQNAVLFCGVRGEILKTWY